MWVFKKGGSGMKTIQELIEWLGDIKISAMKREDETYSETLENYNQIVAILTKEQENE
jgi:hypothetical protein